MHAIENCYWYVKCKGKRPIFQIWVPIPEMRIPAGPDNRTGNLLVTSPTHDCLMVCIVRFSVCVNVSKERFVEPHFSVRLG